MRRLAKQERARGCVSKDLEFVVERLMQVFKTGVGRRVSKSPEKVFINGLLLRRALRRCQGKHPGIDLSVCIPTRVGLGGKKRWRGEVDSGPDGRMLGIGYPLPPDVKEIVSASVRRYVVSNQPIGWVGADVAAIMQKKGPGCVLLFQKGVCNRVDVFAESNKRAKKRSNFWVAVRFETDTTCTRHVARVLHCVLVPHPRFSDIPPLRLAVCALYKSQAPVGRAMCAHADQVDSPAISIHVDTIDGKLVCASPEGFKKGMMYFMQCVTMTAR